MTDTDSTPLNSALNQLIRELCEAGYQAFDSGDYKLAIRRFYEAWTHLPKPQTQWQEAGWVLTALGDAYFAKGDFKSGREALTSALHCPETLGNPFIHLRLGQCLFELNQFDAAREQFLLVKQHQKNDLFAAQHPKYQRLISEPVSEFTPIP